MHVELDAFSGRPNPQWDLSDAEAAQFSRRLAALPATQSAMKTVPQGLGFRGLKISGVPGYDSLVVYHDIVEASGQDERRQWTDPSRSLENFLLQTAQQHLEPSLYDLVKSVIQR